MNAQELMDTAWMLVAGDKGLLAMKEFKSGIEQTIKLASKNRTVIMCAETVPWRCHRSLIGEALAIRDIHVEDIMNKKTSRPHKITPWAIVDGIIITYPETEQDDDSGDIK